MAEPKVKGPAQTPPTPGSKNQEKKKENRDPLINEHRKRVDFPATAKFELSCVGPDEWEGTLTIPRPVEDAVFHGKSKGPAGLAASLEYCWRIACLREEGKIK